MALKSTKAKILDAAVDLFHRQGYGASGVQDVVAAAGVPKGSFYNHFSSKEVLAITAIRRYWEGGAALLTTLRDDGRPPIERLRAYFAILAAVARHAEYRFGCMIGNLGSELGSTTPAVRDEISTTMTTWSGALAVCIRDGQRDGTIRRDLDAERLGTFLLDAWEGALLRAKIDRSDAPIDAFTTIALDALLRPT